MAIASSDYLRVQKGSHNYLLLRSATHFHLIRIDASLSESKMSRLLRLYPCTTDRLQKKGFHVSAFKSEHLRGVVITGCQAGNTIELWIGRDVRKYRLGCDYTDEILARFFHDLLITRRFSPEREGFDPSVIRKITWLVNCISIVCSVLFYFICIPYKLWSVLCIVCQLSAIILALLFPASFTLADDSRKPKQYTNKGKGHLLPACSVPGIVLCLKTLTDFTFRDSTFEVLLLASLIAAISLCVIYFLLAKGSQNGFIHAIEVVLVLTIFILGTVSQLNYVLDFNHTDRQVAEIIDKQVTRHTKSTSFTVTVMLPDGEQLELLLSGRAYLNVEIGDDITVTHHIGAFHIPFSTVEAQAGVPSTG